MKYSSDRLYNLFDVKKMEKYLLEIDKSIFLRDEWLRMITNIKKISIR